MEYIFNPKIRDVEAEVNDGLITAWIAPGVWLTNIDAKGNDRRAIRAIALRAVKEYRRACTGAEASTGSHHARDGHTSHER